MDEGSEPASRDLVVIGASAGGVEALKALVAQLPRDLPAAVCIVLHIAPSSTSALAGILARAGDLACRPAESGDPLVPGEILVAPPDHHLLVDDARALLDVGPRENGHRPAVDALFRSAAEARGDRVLGVVLSGTRDDGAAGLAAIKARGGAALVQDPAEAAYPGMPSAALAHVAVDAVAPTALLGAGIDALVRGTALPDGAHGSVPGDRRAPQTELTLVCPECGGVLSEHEEHRVTRWRCHVGHLYSPQSLYEAQGADVEAALWTALRALEDRAALLRRLGEQALDRAQPRSARTFERQAAEAQEHARILRGVVDVAAATRREEKPAPEGDAA